MTPHQRRRPLWRAHLVCILVMGCPAPALVQYSGGTHLSYEVVPLHVSPSRELTSFWKVLHAELRENFTATWGYVEVKNISGFAIDFATMYCELYDDAGRHCFSLAFSTEVNEQGRRGSLAPGETRTLRSVASSLAPAVLPTELRLYLILQKAAGEPAQSFQYSLLVRRPPITSGGGTNVDRVRVQLRHKSPPEEPQVEDLGLALADVDVTGRIRSLEILNSIEPQFKAWFQEVLEGFRFTTPCTGESLHGGKTLFLVKGFQELGALLKSPYVARHSPWLKGYVENLRGGEIPPVTEIPLAPPPLEVKRFGSLDPIHRQAPPPGVVEYSWSGSGWEPEICPDLGPAH